MRRVEGPSSQNKGTFSDICGTYSDEYKDIDPCVYIRVDSVFCGLL